MVKRKFSLTSYRRALKALPLAETAGTAISADSFSTEAAAFVARFTGAFLGRAATEATFSLHSTFFPRVVFIGMGIGASGISVETSSSWTETGAAALGRPRGAAFFFSMGAGGAAARHRKRE